MLARRLAKAAVNSQMHTEAHRFWKVATVRSTAESTLKEIKFTIDGVDTALTNFTKYDLSTGSWSYPAHGSFDCLFDGIVLSNNASYYNRTNGNIIVAVDLGEPKCVTEVLLAPQSSSLTNVYNPTKEVRIYYSDDNVNWTQTPVEHIGLALADWRGALYKRFVTGL